MFYKPFTSDVLCSGADTKGGRYKIEGNKMKWSYQMEKNVYKMGDWCDDHDFIQDKDPRFTLKARMNQDLNYVGDQQFNQFVDYTHQIFMHEFFYSY